MKLPAFLAALTGLVTSVAAAQTWENNINQLIISTAGTSACTSTYFGGTSCGMYLIGILTFLVYIAYCFTVGLSSEATIPLAGLLLIFLTTIGFLPAAIGFAVVVIAGILIYKGISQVPNG